MKIQNIIEKLFYKKYTSEEIRKLLSTTYSNKGHLKDYGVESTIKPEYFSLNKEDEDVGGVFIYFGFFFPSLKYLSARKIEVSGEEIIIQSSFLDNSIVKIKINNIIKASRSEKSLNLYLKRNKY